MERKKIIRDFSRAAKTYDDNAILQRKVAEELFANFRDFLPEGNSLILDIGCGTGYFHELLRKNKLYLPLVQMDISANMCDVAAGYASSPPYGDTYTINADMEYLPYKDKTFTAVFSSMVFQWAEDLVKTLSEARKVCRGQMFFSMVADGSLSPLKEAFREAGYNAPVHNFPTEKDVMAAIAAAGLKIVEIYSKTFTLPHNNFTELLYSIKNVGAGYKGNREKILSRKALQEIEDIYHKNSGGDGIKSSWNILFARVSCNIS